MNLFKNYFSLQKVIIATIYVLFFIVSGCGNPNPALEIDDEVFQSAEVGNLDTVEPQTDNILPALSEEDDENLADDQDVSFIIPEFEEDIFFYYFFDEKIFLDQVTNKICLKFETNISEEQLLAIVNSVTSLQLTDNHFGSLYRSTLCFAILETKDGVPVPVSTINSFKARSKVISVEYLYQHNGGKFQAITDEFTVKLKKTTTYAQLQQLARQTNCVIGEESQFVKNQFKLYVSKTSNYNAMQLSCLFYETELFEFSEPNAITLDAFDF